MQIACVHCGKSFTIAPEQFGTRGRCPHCRGEIRLPKATDPAVAQEAEQPEEPATGGRIPFPQWRPWCSIWS